MLHPLDGRSIAIVRLVLLGPRREPYYRAVSPESDRSQRRLIGYWAPIDHAHDGALALYEQLSGESLSGGGRAPTRQLVPQKPPPGERPPSYAARPAKHASRA